MPSQLRPLARANRALLFDLLFASASRTLLELGRDPERLGAQLGITAVLHTWTRELTFHPHLHCIVSGGGLAPEGDTWRAASRRYLFPVKVLGALFRGKVLVALRRLRDEGRLAFTGAASPFADAAVFDALVDRLCRTNWVVYSKKPFAGPEHIFRYLGRYTHRVGISNQRLQAVDENGVRFATKGNKTVTLAPDEFIRRFLDHVLPAGFTKIRHFGLHAAGNVRTRLARARALLTAEPTRTAPQSQLPPADPTPLTLIAWQDLLLALTGLDLARCPRCAHPLLRRALPRPSPAIADTS